jgi:hypothetical protein
MPNSTRCARNSTETIEAMIGADGDVLATMRAEYMRSLLTRFNDHLRGPN